MRAELKDFVEVYVSTPPTACVERDPSGLWKRALAGEVRNFTGVDDPYEPPENPEFNADLSDGDIDHAADALLDRLHELGYLSRTPPDDEHDLEK
ncbi:MAG: adenylyl-sulfate kinase, partial [Myxococcota bacterium]